MSRLALIAGLAILLGPALARAQNDDSNVSLGDIARAVRESKPAQDAPVIDNDNLHVMMDKAEAERLNGEPVFSIDPSGKTFRMTSPDGTCSLSFDANATALISAPYIASPLPQYELLNLAGSASIHDGALEITLHNGTNWDVKEIVVAVTLLQSQVSPELMPAKLLAPIESLEKLPDATALYHLKASAAPDSTTVFRGNVGDGLADVKDWHWSLISARGVPPAAPGSNASQKPDSPSTAVAVGSAGTAAAPAGNTLIAPANPRAQPDSQTNVSPAQVQR